MDVMLDFICMGSVDLPGAHRKRQNTKYKREYMYVIWSFKWTAFNKPG